MFYKKTLIGISTYYSTHINSFTIKIGKSYHFETASGDF